MKNSLVYIHPEAKIAKNVEIEPFTTIAKNVEIGEGTTIGPNVTILEGTRIGKNCKIFTGAVIGAVPQDLKFAGEETIVEIGDNTTIREYVTINRGTKSKGKTIVGNNCLLMAYVHIAHDCIIGNNVILVNCVQVAGEVIVDDWAILGGLCAVHQFVRIGKHVIVRGGSLVSKDVPPFIRVAHEPLRFSGLNSIGLRRRNFSNEQINQIQDSYRIVFQSDLNYSDAIRKIEDEFPATTEINEIVNFFKNSSRGIIKGFNSVIEEEED